MTIVVLVVLAGIWAAVLVPPMLRARAEGRPADSIGSFRRQLHVLERTGPVMIAPAHRLGHSRRAGHAATHLGLVAAPIVRRPTAASMARKRRRDVLYTLLAAMGGSLILGLIPSLRVMWGLHLVLDVLFVAYVSMLVRMRNVAAEREMKVRFLPSHMALAGHASQQDFGPARLAR